MLTDVRHFFEVVCPRVLAARRDAAATFGGSFAFVVGDDAWRIDLASAEVKAGDTKADVVVETGSAELAALLKGSLDVPRARREGRFTISGDAERLVHLSLVLRP
jgi:hypothetical protein